jgi:hypothetical protein
VDGGDYDDSLPDIHLTIRDCLKNRRSTVYITANPHDAVADLQAPATRSALEAHSRIAAILKLREIQTLKNGDMSGGDYTLTNAISRVVYEAERETTGDRAIALFCGVCCPSAEIENTMNYSLFESGRDTNKTRATLVPHVTAFALDEKTALNEALSYLGLPRMP